MKKINEFIATVKIRTTNEAFIYDFVRAIDEFNIDNNPVIEAEIIDITKLKGGEENECSSIQGN